MIDQDPNQLDIEDAIKKVSFPDIMDEIIGYDPAEIHANAHARFKDAMRDIMQDITRMMDGLQASMQKTAMKRGRRC